VSDSCQVYHSGLPSYLSNEIEKIQKRAMNIIYPELPYNEALKKAKLPYAANCLRTWCLIQITSSPFSLPKKLESFKTN